MNNPLPNWLKQIAHNFTDIELNKIQKSALIDSNAGIIVNGIYVNPAMLGAPIILPKWLIQDVTQNC